MAASINVIASTVVAIVLRSGTHASVHVKKK